MNKSSQYKTLTATGVVSDAPCFLVGLVIHDPAANTFLIYDSPSAAANLVFKLQQAAAGQQVIMFTAPVAFYRGIYYSVTGANSTATFLLA